MRPLALGYLRRQAGDYRQTRDALIVDMHGFAEREGLTLGDVFTDAFDASGERQGRSAFCALMDALRRSGAHAVIIPSPCHLSRQPESYRMRSAIIEREAGVRLLVVHSQGERP